MRPEHWMFTIPLRLRSLFRTRQADQQLDDELRDHLERKTGGISRRTREIGMRMALGARRGDILRMILSQTASLVAAGVSLGLLAAVFATAFLRAQLFGITPRDPATFLSVAVLFALLALLATYVPAHRAMRVDPMVALRHE